MNQVKRFRVDFSVMLSAWDEEDAKKKAITYLHRRNAREKHFVWVEEV